MTGNTEPFITSCSVYMLCKGDKIKFKQHPTLFHLSTPHFCSWEDRNKIQKGARAVLGSHTGCSIAEQALHPRVAGLQVLKAVKLSSPLPLLKTDSIHTKTASDAAESAAAQWVTLPCSAATPRLSLDLTPIGICWQAASAPPYKVS